MNLLLPYLATLNDPLAHSKESPCTSTSSSFDSLPRIDSSPRLQQQQLHVRAVHSLIILNLDDCLFPTSVDQRFWELFGAMPRAEELRVLKTMMAPYDNYLAIESTLSKLFDDGCTVKIATNANQSWIDLAMSFLPKTSQLLRDNHAYPQYDEEVDEEERKNKKIINRDIVEQFMQDFRHTNLRRALIIAVGDQQYDVEPLQKYRRNLHKWLVPKSRRQIDGYTIKTRTDAYHIQKMTLETHMMEMNTVLRTMRTIFDTHNNQRLWWDYAQRLLKKKIEAETAWRNALKERDEKRDKRTQACIQQGWAKTGSTRKLRSNPHSKMFDKQSKKLQKANAEVESCWKRCVELQLQYREALKAFRQHTRFLTYDFLTRIYVRRDNEQQFVAVPRKTLTFDECCQKLQFIL